MDRVETAPDDTYVNQAYYDLKDTDPDKFALLEKLRKWHLIFQQKLTRDSKLYMDLPRFRQENLESMQSGEYVKLRTQRLRKVVAGAKTWLTRGRTESNVSSGEPDDFQEGLDNANLEEAEEMSVIRFMELGVSDEEGAEMIPIQGIANIPAGDISLDVLSVMNRYMFSAEHQKHLQEINPMIKGLKDVINDPKSLPKDLTKASIRHKEDRNIMRYKTKKGNRNRRRDLINFMYGREFKGEIFGDQEHLQWFNKFTSMMMKGANFSFFALNIPQGVKNYWGILWQQTLEAAAGSAYAKQTEDYLAPSAFNA